MEMINSEERDRTSSQTDAPSRVPVRKLALVTGLTCVVAQLLSQMSGYAGDKDAGPLSLVIGQALWNAAQVGLLLLLLCLWHVRRRSWAVALAITILACLPFAIYAISPGAWALTVLLLATCGLASTRDVPDLSVVIADAPGRGTPALAKFELLAFVCTLFSSMYNFNANKAVFPYWSSIFERVAALAGFTTDQTTIAHGMYTLGLDGVTMPAFIKVGFVASNLGSVTFAIIWTVLPTLYVLYFAACARLAKYSYGTRLQQALCLLCIFHFLFLTDLVDYRYGRGIANPAEEWAHWAERFAWRIAILLPIYQKFTTGHWLRGNGIVGVAVHYTVAAWATGFLIYQVLIYDVVRFHLFALGEDPPPLFPLFGLAYKDKLGYFGALLVMTLVYGFSLLGLRCKRISTFVNARK